MTLFDTFVEVLRDYPMTAIVIAVVLVGVGDQVFRRDRGSWYRFAVLAVVATVGIAITVAYDREKRHERITDTSQASTLRVNEAASATPENGG